MRPSLPVRQSVSIAVLLLCTGGAGALTLLLNAQGVGEGSIRFAMLLAIAAQSLLLFWTIKRFWWSDRRDPFHPLVFIGIVSVLPMNILDGFYTALGGYVAEAGLFGGDFEVFYAEALSAACLGIGFLTIGYMLPLGVRVAQSLPLSSVPLIDKAATGAPLGVLAMTLAGVGANYLLMLLGRYGSSLGAYDESKIAWISLLLPLSQLFTMGLFLAFFYGRFWRRYTSWRFILIGMVGVSVVLALLSGGRSRLLNYALIMIAGVSYSRFGDFKPRFAVKVMGIIAISLVVGVLFGSTFRELRNDFAYGAQLSPQETWGLVGMSAEELEKSSLQDAALSFVQRLFERLSAMDHLAVTLKRADQLKMAEQALGMNSNITKESFWAFIPRPLWPKKPIVSDIGLNFTRLYLDSSSRSWNGPSIFGDLYRNYGWPGIPVGMCVMGIFLRTVYTRYVLMAVGNGLSNALYISILMAVGYEGGYSGYIAGSIRSVFLILLAILMMYCLGATKRHCPSQIGKNN